MSRFLLLVISLCLYTLIVSTAQAETRFFPPGVWGKTQGSWTTEGRDAFYEEWFGGQLAAMKELPLPKVQSKTNALVVLRLLFLPTFDHGGMVRVAFLSGGRVKYEFKSLSGAGGYDPGQVNYRKKGNLSPEAAAELNALIEKIAPFTGKTSTEQDSPEYICTDGTQIVLEFASKGAYQVISRHECDLKRTDDIRALTHLLDNVAGGRLITEYTFVDPVE